LEKTQILASPISKKKKGLLGKSLELYKRGRIPKEKRDRLPSGRRKL